MEVKKPVTLSLNKAEFKDLYRIENGVYLFKTYLAGEWFSTGETLDVRSPIDSSVFAKVPRVGPEVVEKVVTLAYTKGRREVRDTPGEKRLGIYHRVADLLEELKDDFIDVLVVNNGKTRQSALGEVAASVERLRRADLDVRKLYGDYVPGDWSSESLQTEAIVRREPLGLVLAITPFNYPLFDVVNKFVYTTVAGNAMMLKPSTLTPLPPIMFARLLELAGFPKTGFSVLTSRASDISRAVRDPRVEGITLTGSTETGEAIMREGGIKQYVMELGGGDPAIVLSDADVSWAAQRIASGITSYSGQRCDSVKLVMAEPQVYDQLKSKLVEELSKVKVGDPREPDVNFGPIIEESTIEELEAGVKDALSKGGKVLFGGRRLGRNYVEPTLIEVERERIGELMLYNKEVFLSVALITKVKDELDAISVTNNRRYGLDASVFSNDMTRVRRVIRQLEVGAVYVNDYPRHGIGYFPFGGRKASGVAREGIGYTIEYVTSYKTVMYNYRGKGVWEYL